VISRTQIPDTHWSQSVSASREAFSKVPEITLFFWILKIACTTLGEIGGDAVREALINEPEGFKERYPGVDPASSG
jgi:hypothetical protein